jgi:outer membrane murein-binding lipoprotein Lpp
MTYSSSLAVSRQRFATRNQNTTTFQARERRVGPVSNTIILIVLACVLGLLYLTQVTKTNAYSYQIHDLKSQQAGLRAEHDQLAIDAARLQAQERVKNSDVTKNMVSVAPAGVVQN